MRKWIVFVVVLLLAHSVLALEIKVRSESGGIGDEIMVDIDINSDVNIYGVQVDISYNPDILKFIRIEKGGYFESDGGGSFDSNVLGGVHVQEGKIDDYVVIRGLSESVGVSGKGKLATIIFKGLSEGESVVDISKVLVSDEQGNPTGAVVSVDKGIVSVGKAGITGLVGGVSLNTIIILLVIFILIIVVIIWLVRSKLSKGEKIIISEVSKV